MLYFLRFLIVIALIAGALGGCATTRELSLGRPVTQAAPLPPLPGSSLIDGDEFYIQWLSEFELKDSAGEESCHEVGSGYRKGGITTQLMFQVRNEALRFSREVPGFVYEAAAGRCNSSLEAKKVYLTPWMRMDTGKDVQIDYRFLNQNSAEVDMGKLGSDVGTASNVLALSGVGTGVALLGKLASGWMASTNVPQTAAAPQNPAISTGQRHQENRSLPPALSFSAHGANVSQFSFPVTATEAGSMNPMAKPENIGEVKVFAEIKPSLLLKTASNGLPDGRDLTLEELWRTTIQNGSGGTSLQQFIQGVEHSDRPNLQPDWSNSREVEQNCRKLKVVMKELGFNKFDRAAVLYYFLDKTGDWRSYNVTGQKVLSGEVRLNQLQQYRTKNFAGCLIEDDYDTMKRMGLAVNTDRDWSTMMQQIQEKEAYFGGIRSLERQLLAALRNVNAGEMEHQLYPLITTRQGVSGQVLLQNHLGNFGLEALLNVPTIPGEGIAVTTTQLAQVFTNLKVAELSCARPAFEQGRPIPKVAILLFATQPESPLSKGGALEFEFDGGKINRLAFQTVAFRDFRQDILDHPEIGDCRIESSWLERL